MSRIRLGQCQCGAIQYRLVEEPLVLYLCHCRDCQKQSSSAFGMSLWMERDAVEFTSGQLKFWTTKGDSGAAKICAFCGDCGTRIYHASDDNSNPLSIKAGTLNDTSWLRPVGHIWTKSAQPWVTIDPDTHLCYEQEPDDGFDELLAKWKDSNHG